MNNAKKKITLKVFFSYLALLLLVVIVGWVVYGEINSFTRAQTDDTREKDKILRIGKLLTLMYESESFARVAIQSTDPVPYANYLKKNDSISQEINKVKDLVENPSQQSLLDSVQHLLNQKIKNISDLREIRINDNSQESIKNAIKRLSNMEATLGRLTMNDFIENPSTLNDKNRRALEETITILNSYIPRDSTNTVDQKTLDSIVTASRTILQKIEEDASRQRFALRVKERQLLKNDLITTQQLRTILATIETEFFNNSTLKNAQRKAVLKRSIYIVTIAAIIGLLLVVLFSLVILSDFWKNQRYREQIEKANIYTQSLLKSREQLISMVSHDLRSPLGTIVGYTELMKNIPQNSKGSYYIDRIKNAASYVTRLVDDLLDYNKLEAGKINIENIPFDLEKLIRETAENIRSNYPEKAIDLIISIDSTIPKLLKGDPFRIRQIVSNLIGNAFKFTAKGAVTIRVKFKKNSVDENFIHLLVKDTGIGIPEENQPFIFEEFTQADTSIEKKYGGFGLGLTISKKLADLLNGHLSLESKVEEGSTFSFIFPVNLCDSAKKPEITQENELKKELGAIVIDDDETLLALTTEILEQNGMKVHAFTSGKDALEQLKYISYDFIITDIQLPLMNGFYFAEKLQSDNSLNYQNQPIIAVSGRKNLKKKDYREAGFAGFLVKPFFPEDLLNEIENLVQNDVRLQKENKNTEEIYETAAFNLNPIAAFLNNDSKALEEVLEMFIENTHKNLAQINQLVVAKDLEGLSQISHKMLTMFRQIEAKRVLPHLEYFEFLNSFDRTQVAYHHEQLKKTINTLFEELKSTETF